MTVTSAEIDIKIASLEAEMMEPDFWADKARAQNVIKEIQDLKDKKEGVGRFDREPAIVTIFAGAGGDDAEDFGAMLARMYLRYAEKSGSGVIVLHKNENDHGGIRNFTFEISAKGSYGRLKNESGVHRLVRVSPFSSKQLRHTSFCMVEVIPKFPKTEKLEIPENELKVDFARSGGPGGQNVNKRETAVRVVHIPTGLSVHSSEERSQLANRDRAMEILRAKLFKKREEDRLAEESGMQISKTTSAEWGSQIRSYVMHPYKMVKDHRTGVIVNDVEGVLDGELEPFIEAEWNLKDFEKTKIKETEEEISD